MPRARRGEDGRSDVAYVGEDSDSEDFGRAAATFDAHVETAAGGFVEGPEGVSLDEALAWARARAPRVLVILDGGPAGAPEQTLFSAGTELIEEEGVHPWPQAGIEVRPRPVGTRADGADQTRDWPISIKFTVSQASPQISQRARHVLAQASALKSQLWRQDGSTVAFRAEVRAGGYKELEAIVDPVIAAFEAELGVHLTDMTVNLAVGRS
jgi:hypothetical protein